jgi:hypothetical protein
MSRLRKTGHAFNLGASTIARLSDNSDHLPLILQANLLKTSGALETPLLRWSFF